MKTTTFIAFILDDAWWEQFRESANQGIGYWASTWQWNAASLTVTEDETGEAITLAFQEIADAGGVLARVHREVMDALCDAGNLDPDAADLLVQQAAFSDIRYG